MTHRWTQWIACGVSPIWTFFWTTHGEHVLIVLGAVVAYFARRLTDTKRSMDTSSRTAAALRTRKPRRKRPDA